MSDSRQSLPAVRDFFVDVPHYSPNPDHPVLFYGGPFSNFVGGPWVIESEQPWGQCVEVYKTVEHWYQASKARILVDHLRIAQPQDPWSSKKAGNSCDLREDWESLDPNTGMPVKYEVMMMGLRAKFDNEAFRDTLLSTGDRPIAEDSPTDFLWGLRDARGGWTGENLLGRALMQLRDEIRGA